MAIQDDLTFVTGKHSIKTGFEGRFYYVDNDSADGTASYNFNSAQSNLPGFDQQTGYSYASFLLGAVSFQPSRAGRQPRLLPAGLLVLRPGRFQGLAQADAQPGTALDHRPGPLRKQRLRNQPRSEPAEPGRREPPRRPSVHGSGRGEDFFIDTDYGALEPRVGVAYAVSDKMAISGGYSVSHRAATAYGRGGDDFGSLDSTGYNANISVTRTTRPTPNAQDPVMYLSEAYPSVPGTLPNYDPSQQNNQGFDRLITGNEARRDVPQLQRDGPTSAPRQLLADGCLYRCTRPRSAIRLAQHRLRGQHRPPAQSDPVRCGRTIRRSAVQQPLSQRQLGIPLPYPGFAGTVQQALRPFHSSRT